ncbi:EF-hand domain-containing protein [Clostridium sp. DL1XJH146]
MIISGASSFSYNPYSSTTLKSSVAASSNTEETTNPIKSSEAKPKRPQGPPPGGTPKGGKGPNVDTNDDDIWSVDEVETFVSESGSLLDVDEFFSEYDIDGDGSLDSSEVETVAQNNGLQLELPRMMNSNIDFENEERNTLNSLDTNYSAEMINQMISAYTSNNSEYQQSAYAIDATNILA